MGGDELTCGSVKFPKIVTSSPAQKKQVEDVIGKEVAVIDDLIRLVTMGEKIEVLKGILAQDQDDSIRNAAFNAVYTYLKKGRIKNDANLDKEIDKIVDKVMAKVLADKGVAKYNLTPDRIAKIKESLAFALKRDKVKQVLTFIPTKQMPTNEATIQGWANDCAEYAAYLKDGIDLWDKTVEEYIAVKKGLSEDTLKLFKDAPTGKKRTETLKALIDQNLPGIESGLDSKLRPETKARIDAVKKVECNSEGKECKDVTDSKLRSGALICVRDNLKAVLANGAVAGFVLQPPTAAKVTGDADGNTATAVAEPDSWSYTYDSWLLRNPGIPRLTVGGHFGVSSTPGDLDTKVIGEPDGPITLNAGVRVALDWERFRTGNYGWRFGPYYSYEAKRSVAEDTSDNAANPTADKHQYGVYVMGRSFTPSYFPDFTLRLNGLSYKSSIPMYPNPNETSFNAKGTVKQPVYNWNNGSLAVDAGDAFTYGNYNDLGWMRNTVTLGPRLSFAAPFPISFGAGYQRVNTKLETRFDPYSSSGSYQYNAGNGFYGSAMLDFSPYRAGTVWLGGDMTFMDKFHREGGAYLDYRSPRLSTWLTITGGADYRAENYNNGLSHRVVGRIGLDGLPVFKGLMTLGLEGYGGYQKLDYDSNSGFPTKAGGVVGFNLTGTLGAADKPNKHTSDYYRGYEEDLAAVAPTPVKGDTKPAVQKMIATDKQSVALDPMARMLLGGSEVAVDASMVAAYIIQFKSGALNADYTLGAMPSNMEEAAKLVDGNINTPSAGYGAYGYKLPEAAEVTAGDVAPIGIYVGRTNVLALKDDELKDYLKNIYLMSPDKMRVIKIGVARSQMIKQGVAVKSSNQGTQIAKDLLDSLSLMTTLADDIDPKWAEISAYSTIKDKEQFKKQYKAEMDAQVVGPAVLAMAKYVIAQTMLVAKGAPLNEAETKPIKDLTKLNRDLVNVLMAYSFLNSHPASKGSVTVSMFVPAEKAQGIFNALVKLGYINQNGEIQPKFDENKKDDFKLDGTEIEKDNKLVMTDDETTAVFGVLRDAKQKLPDLDTLNAMIAAAAVKKEELKKADDKKPEVKDAPKDDKSAFDAKKYVADKCGDTALKLDDKKKADCQTKCGDKKSSEEADKCVVDYAPVK